MWFSDSWVDPFTGNGLIDPAAIPNLVDLVGLPSEAKGPLEAVSSELPKIASIQDFYSWLKTDPRAVDFTGSGALFSFNHPNEFGNFEGFALDADLVDRMCAVEMHNLDKDYFFWDTTNGKPFPLNACLNAGWRPGIIGVSDEHGPTLSSLADGSRGRGGVWVTDLSRAAFRDGLADRRMFSTDIQVLRLDVSAESLDPPGPRVRMGSSLVHGNGTIRFGIDLSAGASQVGRPLLVQILTRGADAPTILDTVEVAMQGEEEDPVFIERPVSLHDTDWVVLRFTDPALPPNPEAQGDFAAAGAAVAYAPDLPSSGTHRPDPLPLTDVDADPCSHSAERRGLPAVRRLPDRDARHGRWHRRGAQPARPGWCGRHVPAPPPSACRKTYGLT